MQIDIRDLADATFGHFASALIVVVLVVSMICLFKCATKPEYLCYELCQPRGVVELHDGTCKCADRIPLQTPPQ